MPCAVQAQGIKEDQITDRTPNAGWKLTTKHWSPAQLISSLIVGHTTKANTIEKVKKKSK